MEQHEMVQKLHEKANITIAEARDALERAEWDMLEALVLLEREGKIQPLTASMTTTEQKSTYEEVTATASSRRHERAEDFFDRLKDLIWKGFTHSFVVERKGKEIVTLPVIIAALITLFLFQPVMIAIIIGLFLDCKYAFVKRGE